jgi:prepilin-type N-terminal cleavage/methylation domain-containing protein
MTQRRGFTLVEVLLALVIMGVVTGAIYQLLVTNQRLSVAQAEQVTLQSNVRTGSLIVPNELRELNTVLGGAGDQNDITVADPDGVTYRAMRGLGLLCQDAAANELRLARETWTGLRDPDPARDSLYVFFDDDIDEDDDDTWVQVAITAVDPNSACGGEAAIRLTVAPVAPAVVPLVPANTPVRLYELTRLELYADAAGDWWLGAQSLVDADPQPILGPLTNNGFQLEYLDTNGNPTVDLTAITSVGVTVRGLTDGMVRDNGTAAMGYPVEELATRVLLRNSIRP